MATPVVDSAVHASLERFLLFAALALSGCRTPAPSFEEAGSTPPVGDDEAIRLNCADAEEVARMLWEMLNPRGYVTCAMGRDYDPLGREERPELVGFDRASNSVIVRGPMESHEGLREVIARIDGLCASSR